MSLFGQRVTLGIFAPDLASPLIAPRTATVAGAVEFADVAQHDIVGDGFAVVNGDFDLGGDTILYRVTDHRFDRFAAVPGFNGFAISDADGTVPPIAGVSIRDGTNTLGLPADRIFFNDDAVHVDVGGLAFGIGDGVTLALLFGAEGDPSPTAEALFVARLYTATFGRDPDPGGLNFWIAAAPGLGGRAAVAAAFADSREFEDRFGGLDALTPDAFVGQLYRNILGREGEPEGVAFWAGAIERGVIDEADALASFAVSAENVANTPGFESIALNLGTGEWTILALL